VVACFVAGHAGHTIAGVHGDGRRLRFGRDAEPLGLQPRPAEQRRCDRVQHEPVVVFALEWCEFSWSVRKLFARLGIAYRSIDLDSVAYQAGDLGGKIRAVLGARTNTKTIPQVFIGGTHIGGATEMFDAWRNGKARELLAKRGVAFDAKVELDPYSLLPKWLQPRKTA